MEVPLYFDGPGTDDSLPETMGIHAIPDAITRALAVPTEWPQTAASAQLLISQREDHLAWSTDGLTKAIMTPKGIAVYDLVNDPNEQNPLPIEKTMTDLLTQWQVQHPALATTGAATIQLPDETLKALNALGYVE